MRSINRIEHEQIEGCDTIGVQQIQEAISRRKLSQRKSTQGIPRHVRRHRKLRGQLPRSLSISNTILCAEAKTTVTLQRSL